jgi:hypothetical protein
LSGVPLADALVETTKEAAMGLGRVLKRIGTVAAAPVVVPARKAKEGVEKFIMSKILTALIRHGLTAAGGAGFAVSDDALSSIVSGLVTLAGIAWSIYEKRMQPKPAQ